MKPSHKTLICFAVIASMLLAGAPITAAQAAEPGQGEEINSFCEDPGTVHPVAEAIADTYGTSYEQIMEWFCGIENDPGETEEHRVHGLGQIMLALQTAEKLEGGGDPDQLLAERRAGKGWGQIWQEAGLIGKGRKDKPGKPDHAGPPEGKGKPDHAGPPEGKGKPDHAGPKEKDK